MHGPITKPVLTGARVRLCPLVAADAEAMFASLADEEAMQLTGTQAHHTLEDVKRHCQRCETADDRLDYVILVDDRPVGEVVLNSIDRRNKSASFRIAVWYRENRDKGYGSEATSLLTRHAFEALGLNRIELEVYAFNPRARHVYERAGFVHEGTRRQALCWDGEWIDAHIMAMLRDDRAAG
jgi:RimJ/RimL family protein N-acetyltransferase